MPDYTSIHFWINQLAVQDMRSLGDSEINCNHMVMAACGLDRAVKQSPQGTQTDPMQRQVNRIENAFVAVGTKPAKLSERLKGQLNVGTNHFSSGRSAMVMLAPGVGELSPRAYTLAKPKEPEAAHFLAALLEKPTPELITALESLDIKPSILRDALLTASDKPVGLWNRVFKR